MVVMIERIIQLITFKEVIGSLMIFIAVLIVASIIWGNRTFSVKTLNQMIFHLKVPMDGTDDGIYTDWFLHTVPQSFCNCCIHRNNRFLIYLYQHFIYI